MTWLSCHRNLESAILVRVLRMRRGASHSMLLPARKTRATLSFSWRDEVSRGLCRATAHGVDELCTCNDLGPFEPNVR